MRSSIIDIWLRMRASYWFIPSVMAVAAIVSAVVIAEIDARFDELWLSRFSWLYTHQADGAQALLATIAGSMITVAGVTFSMTLLAVSHATSQIGPGLLVGFMRDRGNQFTLGTFIATFLYSLMVLRTVHGEGFGESSPAAFVPHLALIGAIILAVVSVLVLIYFFHHVPQSISVANVVAEVGKELRLGMETMYPKDIGNARRGKDDLKDSLPNDFENRSCAVIVTGKAGYIRVVDSESLMNLAASNDIIIQLLRSPGDFILPGQRLMRLYPAERLTDEIEKALNSAYSCGAERTPEQDILLPVEQLLEIMGKALSPGINNQSTALLCINQLELGLAAMLRRETPDLGRIDEDGKLRVIAKPVTHEQFIDAIFEPMRQYVCGDWIATTHVLQMLGRLVSIAGLREFHDTLYQAAALILNEAQESSMSSAQKESIGSTLKSCALIAPSS